MDLSSIIKKLSHERPLFHSEADFQHALAWEIHKENPQNKIRLEYNPSFISENMYIDIWIDHPDGRSSAIELKYIAKKMTALHNRENFNLKNHGATDLARYDFIKDIVRLEKVVSHLDNVNGYALILSNEPQLWKEPIVRQKIPNDIEFRIHQDQILQGNLSWGPNTGKGTMRGRENPLKLINSYEMKWLSYIKMTEIINREFMYSLIKIPSKE